MKVTEKAEPAKKHLARRKRSANNVQAGQAPHEQPVDPIKKPERVNT